MKFVNSPNFVPRQYLFLFGTRADLTKPLYPQIETEKVIIQLLSDIANTITYQE